MECNNRLHDASDNFGLSGQQRIAARFGINTGEMLVGNIGSKRRFNHAAMGDAANLGSRLEGANKFFWYHHPGGRTHGGIMRGQNRISGS